MKNSERLKDLSLKEENDFKAWTHHFQSERWKRQEFFEEMLPKIREQVGVIERENGSFTFNHPSQGKIDLYPKKNKALIRSKNKWVTNGFQYIVKHFKLKLD